MAGERGKDRQPSRGDSERDLPVQSRTGAPVHTTTSVVAVAAQLPSWATLVRAPNPGPMTLDGTNTWVLRNGPPGEPVVVVDPGPDDAGHLREVAATGPVAAVLTTHGHPDHVAGLASFQQLTGAPVLAAPEWGAGRPHRVAGLSLRRVDTPGHTADSVCFLVEAAGEQAICTGDTILGRGTTVVAWPDGDLGDYLRSLRRLTDYRGVPALPGHGPPLTDCAAAAHYYLDHRWARLAQVRAAVAAGATTPAEVVALVYADVGQELQTAAEWTVRAQLAYLERHEWESSPHRPPLDSP